MGDIFADSAHIHQIFAYRLGYGGGISTIFKLIDDLYGLYFVIEPAYGLSTDFFTGLLMRLA